MNHGWHYPLVVKGSIYEAIVAYTIQQAVAAFNTIAGRWGHPILVQSHIVGDECNLCTIGDGQGGLIGPVMMKKRGLTDKGKAWAGVCIEDDVLLEAAQRLIAHLKWRGPCEIEGIRSANGNFHLLEINPRFPAWVYFTHGVGRNLPAALVEVAQGRPPPNFPRPAVGALFIRYAEEVVLPSVRDRNWVVTPESGNRCRRPSCQSFISGIEQPIRTVRNRNVKKSMGVPYSSRRENAARPFRRRSV